jgi:hypothetical protein
MLQVINLLEVILAIYNYRLSNKRKRDRRRERRNVIIMRFFKQNKTKYSLWIWSMKSRKYLTSYIEIEKYFLTHKNMQATVSYLWDFDFAQERDRETDRQRDRKTERQRHRETRRQSETERQRDRKTDRQGEMKSLNEDALLARLWCRTSGPAPP